MTQADRSKYLEPIIHARRYNDQKSIDDHITLLENLGPETEIAVSVFIEALQDLRFDVCGAAAWALGIIGPAAKDAVPALGETLHPGVTGPFIDAVEILGKIGPAAIPGLLVAIRYGTSDVRRSAYDVLREIGWAAKDAIPELIYVMQGENGNAALDAIDALGEIGADAIPALIDAVGDKDWRGYVTPWDALAAIGPAAVPALIDVLRHEDPRGHYGAASALEEIGPAAKDAIPELIAALGDKDHDLRFQAEKALKSIDLDVATKALKKRQEDLKKRQEEEAAAIAQLLEWAKRGALDSQGIEVMEDKALRIKVALDTFRRIGEICQERKQDKFSFKEMQRLLGLEDSTTQGHVRNVSEFFREYFKKYEGVDLAVDFDKTADVGRKVIDRPGERREAEHLPPLGLAGLGIDMSLSGAKGADRVS